MIEEIKDKQPAATAIEVWFQDEARVVVWCTDAAVARAADIG